MRKIYTRYKFLFIILLVQFITLTYSNYSYSATLKGVVVDASTKEQVIGAMVRIKELNISAVTNLEGIYIFKNIAPGTYTMECKFLGLKSISKNVTVSDANADVNIDFSMENASTLLEVNVVGHQNNETELNARKSEHQSDYETNILSAQSIQLLPDITIANTLQRISGVTVERNSTGDGQFAIVRGMDKRYNYTTINGIKIPSPDNKNRYVPLNIFPADIVERIEVNKTLLPSMEADAIGGAVNLQLRNAPDYLMIKGTVAGGYNQINSQQPFQTYNADPINFKSPNQIHGTSYDALVSDFPKSTNNYSTIKVPINSTANIIIGDRFLNHKLGVLVAASYQNVYKGTNEYFFEAASQPVATNPDGSYIGSGLNRGNVPSFDFVDKRTLSTQLTTYAVHAKLDYQINNLNSLSFYTLYVQSRSQQVRYSEDTATAVNLGLLDHEQRSVLTVQSIYNATLQGNHILLPGLKLDWSAVYAIASNNQPDYSTLSTENNYYTNTPPYSYLLSLTNKWTSNTDQDLAEYLNLTYNYNLAGSDLEIKVGEMDRHKDRNNYYAEYKLSPLPPSASQNQQEFTTFNNAIFYWSPAGAANGAQDNPNTYTATEDVTAGYGQVKYTFFNKLQLLTGVRVENTSHSYDQINVPITTPAQHGSGTYYDVLPGIHLKYMIDNLQNLRLSYYQSITRPGFFENTPYKLPGDYYDEVGNPFLKHTTADNYDLRYELYPKGVDQILVGVFYKNLYDPIQYAFVREGTSSQALQPQNFNNATNYGVEAVVTKFFGVFGLSANYTYTNSSIMSKKAFYYQTIGADGKPYTPPFDTIMAKTPLQGQAAHIGNLSLIYKNTKQGLDAEVAFIYTGKHIAIVSPYYGLDYWQRANLQLDFSAEKSINKHFSVYIKLANLLNTPTVYEIDKPNVFKNAPFPFYLPAQDSPNNIKTQQDYYGPSYLGGVRYTF